MQENVEEIELLITEDDRTNFKRLDHFLAAKLTDYSRSFLKLLFEAEMISGTLQGQEVKVELKKMPPVGTLIEIDIPPPLPTKAEPENIPLTIIFEDEHLVIVDKPAGMCTHPAPGNYTGTLVNAILHHCPDISGVGMEKRPGIVHRLDKGTSGVMVVAKTAKTHEALVTMFSKHDLERRYEALMIGHLLKTVGTLSSPIGRDPHNRLKMAVLKSGGKIAITHFKTLYTSAPLNHVEFKLETGRTHQIRVHASSLLNAPILMDELYGNTKQQISRLPENIQTLLTDYPYQLLHAKKLAFTHPITKKELVFESAPPIIFQKVLELTKGKI